MQKTLWVIGRLLQFVALVMLPVAMALQMTDRLGRKFGVSDMLVMLLVGIGCFVVGWLIQGWAGRPS